MPKMLLPNTRTRIINFRVTDQEYDCLLSACAISRGNNLSEFARRAVLSVANDTAAPEGGLASRLVSLDERLARLDSSVGELLHSLKALELRTRNPEDGTKCGSF